MRPGRGDSYQIDGVAVSDFVTPAWYKVTPPIGRLHWLDNGKVTEPFALAVLGAVGVWLVPNTPVARRSS